MVSAFLVPVPRTFEELRRLGVVSTGRGRIVVRTNELRALLSTEIW